MRSKGMRTVSTEAIMCLEGVPGNHNSVASFQPCTSHKDAGTKFTAAFGGGESGKGGAFSKDEKC